MCNHFGPHRIFDQFLTYFPASPEIDFRTCFWATSSVRGFPTNFAILIALYRPQFGPPARNGRKKWPKNGFGPFSRHENAGKIGRKMGEMANFPYFSPFFSHFPVGPKSILRPFFPPYFALRRPEAGSVLGNQDRNTS